MPDSREFATLLLKRGYAGVKKIGEGSFGVAVLVQDKDGSQVVVKLVDVSRASKKELEESKRESRLLAQLKHPYIVRYRENFAEKGWLGIVMDFCDGGDVMAQITTADKKKTRIEETVIMRWLTQSMLALKYLHGKHILHRDLKPQNLFLTKTRDLKVGDFGISKVMACTAAFARSFVGTPYYLAPEVIGEKPYSWPADIWSMGCIVYQLCSLKVPFDAANITQLAQKITKAKIPDVPRDYSDDLRKICSDMMHRDVGKRPSSDDIVAYPVVQTCVKALIAEQQTEEKEQKPAVQREVLYVFQQFDRNCDGVIDKSELAEVLKHIDGSVWTEARVNQILKLADKNGDGKIQLDEFVSWMFGGDSNGEELAARLKDTIALVNKAVEDDDLDRFLLTLVGWRQAVDLGCLRVSPPEASIKACSALGWIALSAQTLLENASDKSVALKAAYQMRAIMLTIEQLLEDSRRRRLRRVAFASSRTAVKGVCFEMMDGGRLGHVPSGRVSDIDLTSLNARWELLEDGEYVVKVEGFAAASAERTSSPAPGAGRGRGRGGSSGSRAPSRAPSPAPSHSIEEAVLCSSLILCTNQGRRIEQGNKAASGKAFAFEAKEGEEIVEALFSNQTCKGVRSMPVPLRWSTAKIEDVRAAFKAASESVWTLLVSLSHKKGLKPGRFALLEAKRLGLKVEVPEELPAPVEPPGHWDLSSMVNESGKKSGAVRVQLMPPQRSVAQAIIDLTYCRTANKDLPSALAPQCLELTDAFRLQNSRAWAAYIGKRDKIQGDLKDYDLVPKELCDPTLVTQLASIGAKLDPAEANTAWLFHGISAQAAQDAAASIFDISLSGSEESGGLYGRGVYLTEHCDKIDKQAGDGGGPQGDLHCMLLCRVILGNALQNSEILPDVATLVAKCTGGGTYHSIHGDRSERCPGTTRQFVVYDKDQVYPEYLFFYKRIYR